MSDSRLNYLFGKYFDKTSSAEEREEFMQCILNMQEDDPLLKLMEEAYLSKTHNFYELTPEVKSKILNNIFNAGEEPILNEPVVKKVRVVKLSWVKYVAAVLVMAVGIGIFYKNQQRSNEVLRTVNNHKNNIPPGGNKAVLTLGNGQKIVLDAADNGVLAQQGNISISKTSSGQIVYNIKGKGQGTAAINSIETPVGGQYQVNLPDGTKVWLNASSAISFPTVFLNKERNVQLIKGEAYFEVAKNAEKPFKVNISKNLDVVVLGTHFNINTYANQNTINTTLLEGSVAVKTTDRTEYITPGQQAQFNRDNAQINLNTHVNVNQIIAWKNGYFCSESISLTDLMNEVERWYGVKVVYKDNVQADFVAKLPRNVSLTELIELLELTKLVKFKLNQNILTVMK